MLETYAAFMLITAAHLWRICKPEGSREWAALAVIAAMWPGLLMLTLYFALTPDRNP